jgi:hypothetical protein
MTPGRLAGSAGPPSRTPRPPYEKKSSSKSFSDLRLCAAALLCAIGVGMAMFSFAANPPSGTLTHTSAPLTYTAGPFFVPNAFGNTIPASAIPIRLSRSSLAMFTG